MLPANQNAANQPPHYWTAVDSPIASTAATLPEWFLDVRNHGIARPLRLLALARHDRADLHIATTNPKTTATQSPLSPTPLAASTANSRATHKWTSTPPNHRPAPLWPTLRPPRKPRSCLCLKSLLPRLGRGPCIDRSVFLIAIHKRISSDVALLHRVQTPTCPTSHCTRCLNTSAFLAAKLKSLIAVPNPDIALPNVSKLHRDADVAASATHDQEVHREDHYSLDRSH